MVKSKQHKLDRLLKCTIKELAESIRPMSDKECERYARAILHRIGGPPFDQLLMRIVEIMVPTDGSRPPRNSDEYYLGVRGLFPHVPTESDVIARLLALTMRMSMLRLEKNPPTLTAH